MAARQTLYEPRRWTSTTTSQSSSAILWNMPSRRMPAGLITAMQPAEGVHGLFEHAAHGGHVRHAVGVGDGLATRNLDLLDDRLRRTGRSLVAAAFSTAQVVDHHLCQALASRDQRAVAADAVAAAGDQHHPAVERAHLKSSCFTDARSAPQRKGRVVSRPCFPGRFHRSPKLAPLQWGVTYDWLFPGRSRYGDHMTTRPCARLVERWVPLVELEPGAYGTHSLRRTKVALVYKKAGNLRACQHWN